MREQEFKELKESSWRRRLSEVELVEMQKFLASRPRAAGEWREEEALSRMLERLPAAPVSSNFTARVLAAAQRGEGPAGIQNRATPWFLRNWWPRFAAGVLMVGTGFFSFHEYQLAHRLHEAHELAAASRLAALPSMDWLSDFDTIQRLDKVKVADDELLSVLE